MILVVDNMGMMDDNSHNFTHNAPFSDTDWISSEKRLSGKYGDYEYFISTNRTVWRDHTQTTRLDHCRGTLRTQNGRAAW